MAHPLSSPSPRPSPIVAFLHMFCVIFPILYSNMNSHHVNALGYWTPRLHRVQRGADLGTRRQPSRIFTR
jgi:hypothetical protein